MTRDLSVLFQIGLLLSGCAPSSPIAARIYVLSLRYSNDQRAQKQEQAHIWQNITDLTTSVIGNLTLEFRIGYFGQCARTDSTWRCVGDDSNTFGTVEPKDPLGVAEMANRYQNEVLFPGLV